MIGIFDSGLGGLTALKEIRKILPGEDLVYFGDTGRVPYGPRSRDTIIRYAKQDVRFLLTFKPKAILVACGTVSSTALDELRTDFSIPIVGVVEGAVAAAAKATKNGKIGVIGTMATIRSGAYSRMLRSMGDYEITEVACPLFVPLVENGFTDPGDEITRLACEKYLGKIRSSGCDTLILGCTHYPIIAHAIASCLPGVSLISSGAESAHVLRATLEEKGLCSDCGGAVEYYVSDDTDGFSDSAHIFLGEKFSGNVRKTDIEKY